MSDIRKRISQTLDNRRFRTNVEHSGDRNWLQIDVGEAFASIQEFLETVDI